MKSGYYLTSYGGLIIVNANDTFEMCIAQPQKPEKYVWKVGVISKMPEIFKRLNVSWEFLGDL